MKNSAACRPAVLGILGACALMVAANAPAWAQLGEDARSAAQKDCLNLDGKIPDKRAIDGCTLLINNLEMNPQVEVTLRYLRGSYLVDDKDYDRALLDLDRVVAIYDTAQDKTSWRPEAIEKVTWSYEWRAAAHMALNRCEDATADYVKASQMAKEITERDKYKTAALNACKGRQ